MDRVRLGATAGIGGALACTIGWILGGLLQSDGYSWSRQEISDLGALTAQHAWAWNLADSLSGVLLLIFAFGLYALVGAGRTGRIGAGLVGVVGVGSVLDGLVREDCPLSTSEACQRLQDGPGLSWHHRAHDIESVIVFVAVLAAPFFLARAFAAVESLRDLRRYTLATGSALVVTAVAYVLLYGEVGGGIAQRALILLFMAWILVLSIRMLGERTAAEGVQSG